MTFLEQCRERAKQLKKSNDDRFHSRCMKINCTSEFNKLNRIKSRKLSKENA